MLFRGYKYTYNLNAYHDISPNLNNNHRHTFSIVLYISYIDASVFSTYSNIEKKLNAFLDTFQEKKLNDCELLKGITPTLENIADIFFIKLSEIINGDIFQLEKISISDNLLSWVSTSRAIIPGNCINIIR